MALKVALAGATGNLGPAILKALLDAGFDVTILSRKGSTSTDSLPHHPNQKIIKVDYKSVDDLTAALQGVEAVVSTLTGSAFDETKPLIDAAVAVGVKRFIPSEFGVDTKNPLNQALPVFQAKIKAQEYIESMAKAHPSFTYTYIFNNAFFDWGLKVGFVASAKEHKITLWDGGDVPISMTTVATIGKAVAGTLQNQEATKNRAVFIHDTVFTLRQLIDFVKKIDGKEWTIEPKATKDAEKEAYEELQKPQPNIGKAMGNFIFRGAFSKDHTPDFTGKTDNKLFGVPEDDTEYLTKVVKELL